MRNEIEIAANDVLDTIGSPWPGLVDQLATKLERDGIVVLPRLLGPETLASMQRAFASRLQRIRWNNYEGYQITEPYRHMVEDVLLLDQGFMDLVLHPVVKSVIDRYLGDEYELTEAKGWRSLPTKKDFHGWHGDAWYDESQATEIHKEVKLAIYLSDVRSGAFNYIKGSHHKEHPRVVSNDEVADVDPSQVAELLGPAGTAFLFDTSGIHRQGVPMLEERRACFFNYHNPRVPLMPEAIDYYRYHPLMLNAAFLVGLSKEDERILGFGNKTNFRPAFQRSSRPSLLGRALNTSHHAEVKLKHLKEMILARLKRTLAG
jgi:hypothetical protein